MKLTIDSSIFVETVVGGTHGSLCYDLLITAYKNKLVEIIEPSLLFFEFTNAVTRSAPETNTKKDKQLRIDNSLKICDAFENRENTHYYSLDNDLWEVWRSHIKQNPEFVVHKTQDEIFLIVAYLSNSILVTLDTTLLKKSKCMMGNVKVISPYDCLKLIQELN
jgi:predicted nucleic acid-binding protein